MIPKDSMYYLETYNASEGFFGIQDQVNSEEMLLMLDYGIYYEFIPFNDLNNDETKTIALHQVKLDEQYAMVITTNAGLWRYKIGDTIKFTSLSPYRICITGRTAHFINAFGEEMIIDNAEKALAISCAASHSIIKEYTAAPVYFSDQSSGAHEWLIEFEQEPEEMEVFIHTLDLEIQKLNSDYEAKRYHDKVLRMPIIRIMPNGTFYNWLKSKEKIGGQYKVPRLSNNRKFVDDILNFVKP